MKPLCILTSSFCIFLAGCRTAGPQVALRDCRDCRIEIRGNLDAAQGKSVTGELNPAVSAGVTAQANGNAVSQSGAATASPTGDNDASADSTTSPVRANRESPLPASLESTAGENNAASE